MKILAIALFLFCAGCSTVSNTGLNKFYRDDDARKDFALKHTELSPEIRQAIVEGKIIPGMSKDTIRELFGEPGKKFISESGMYEVWFYGDYAFGFDSKGVLLKFFGPEDLKPEK